MICYSCWSMAMSWFIARPKDISLNDDCISLCCNTYLGTQPPATSLAKTPEETLERYLGMREMIILRGGVETPDDENFACAKCRDYVKADWNFSKQIQFVSFSMYPSPCQCRCFYCNVNKADPLKNSAAVVAYEKLFDTISLAKKRHVIAKNAIWQVVPGEISIHPYKKQIMDLVRGGRSMFSSNMFICDEDIARELHDNPLAEINLSIDAGTAETWHKVKGVNNFNRVLDNLKAYRQAAQNSNQIQLRYIILPGINDSDEEILSLVGIMKTLDIKRLIVSRDARVRDSQEGRDKLLVNDVINPKLVESAARFCAICYLCGIQPEDTDYFTQQEKIQAVNLAQKIIQSVG